MRPAFAASNSDLYRKLLSTHAVGSECGQLGFREKVKSELGVKAMHGAIAQVDGTYALRESGEVYRVNLTPKMMREGSKHDYMGPIC